MLKTGEDFRTWVEDFKGELNSFGFFADWIFKKKEKADKEDTEIWKDKSSIKIWLKKMKAPISIKACFETSWDMYQDQIFKYVNAVESAFIPVSVDRQILPYIETVERHYKDLNEQDDISDVSTIQVRTFATQPANVGVEAGLTVNMGSYETMKIKVSLSVPCYTEEADLAYKVAENWVTSRVRNEIFKLRGQKDKVKPLPSLKIVPLEDKEDDLF